MELNSFALNQPDHYQNNGGGEQNVNKAAEREIGDESKQPCDNQDDSERVKHGLVLILNRC